MSVSWDSYWKYQNAKWRQHDTYSCWCKLVILAGNLATSSSMEQLELRPHGLRGKVAAVVAFVCVAATLVFMHKRQQLYTRLRSGILLLHWLVIGTMVNFSLPLYGGHYAQQPVSSSSSLTVSVLQQLLNLLFRSGAMFCVMGTLMHRLPWQLVFAANALYVVLITATWARPFCTAITDSYSAMSDRPASVPLGGGSCSHPDSYSSSSSMCVISSGNSSNSSSYDADIRSGVSNAAELVIYLASGLDYITGQGQLQGNTWVPRAQNIAALCQAGSSSSSTDDGSSSSMCRDSLEGHCIAVVSTVNIWLGVLLLGFCVIVLEQVAKWQYIQQHVLLQGRHTLMTHPLTDQTAAGGCSLAGSSRASAAAASSSGSSLRSSSEAVSTDLPSEFLTASRGRFVWNQLLRFHVMLDVPLLLLWIGLSRLLRPEV